MTNTETSVPEPFAAVAAFLDGEQVSSAALKQALSTEEGRDYLVDVLALRQLAAGMGPVSFPAPASERRRSLARWAAVAAAIALVASAFGYVAGERAGLSTSVAAAPRTVEAVIDFSEPVRAPEPTQVIRFEPGVNWNASGGN
jgi:hypothetical protein